MSENKDWRRLLSPEQPALKVLAIVLAVLAAFAAAQGGDSWSQTAPAAQVMNTQAGEQSWRRLRDALEREPTNVAAAKSLNEAATAARQRADHHAFVSMQCALARAQFELGDLKQGRARLIEAYTNSEELGGSTFAASVCRVSFEYFRADLVADGLRVLAAADDRQVLHLAPPDLAAAVGGMLHKRLDLLEPSVRYETLLRWTMPRASSGRAGSANPPTKTAPRVRWFAAMCSVEAPPKIFARALGERPADDAFPIPDVSGHPGMFCMGWELVKTAHAQQRLSSLVSQLESRLDKTAPQPGDSNLDALRLENASAKNYVTSQWLLIVAKSVAANPTSKDMESLGKQANEWMEAAFRDATDKVLSVSNGLAGMQLVKSKDGVPILFDPVQRAPHNSRLMLAAILLSNPDYHAVAQTLITRHLAPMELDPNFAPGLAASIRVCAAEEVAAGSGDAPSGRSNISSPLQHWLVAVDATDEVAPGAAHPHWMVCEGHVFQPQSSLRTALIFKYPLQGAVRFTVETRSDRGRPGGGLGFAGFGFHPAPPALAIKPLLLSDDSLRAAPCEFFEADIEPTFHRLAIDVAPDHSNATVEANRHQVHTYKPSACSPWLTLNASSRQANVFRRLRIEGNAKVADEVRLSDDPMLRGWSASRYGRSHPGTATSREARAPQNEGIGGLLQNVFGIMPADQPTHDWRWEAGVIHGRRQLLDAGATSESVLSYLRPLESGDVIQYEYFYQPGVAEVHPALGRLAILIEPRGIRLHWMTAGRLDWTGLGSQNAVIDPLNRRGPKPLPLNANQWNNVEIRRGDAAAELILNSVLVARIPFVNDAPLQFGLFYDQRQTVAQARNVVLRGDWPDELPKDLLASGPHRISETSIGSLVDQDAMSDDVLGIRAEAIALESEEKRYGFLANWVLPNNVHPLRMQGAFTSLHPAPGYQDNDALDAKRLVSARLAGDRRVELGGNLVAPAMMLVESARRLGRLDELRRRVMAAPEDSDYNLRAKLAMLVVLEIAAGDEERAIEALRRLFPLVVLSVKPEGVEEQIRKRRPQRWPDLIAASAGLRYAPTREMADGMSQHLFYTEVRKWKWSGGEAWDGHVHCLSSEAHFLDNNASLANLHVRPDLKTWSTVTEYRSRTRGAGSSRPHWEVNEKGVLKLAGHLYDSLVFQSPLQGDFIVEGDIPILKYRESQLLVGGTWSALRYSTSSIRVGSLRSGGSRSVSPRYTRPRERVHVRVEVSQHIKRTYFNGRLFREETLPKDFDPWIAVRTQKDQLGGIHYLQINGDPRIPEEINLLPADLGGWKAYYDFHQINTSDGWTWTPDGTLRGVRLIDGQKHNEQLMVYHRPMLEDGTIRYQFYYNPGAYLVHPALDRLALILHPDGVREHWITDGAYNVADMDPANSSVEKDYQRGDAVPLKEDQWNSLQLAIKGDVVTVTVNDQLVYERPLEVTNQRHFGLFYYLDQSGALVKDMFWKGDWPRTLEPAAQQELGTPNAVTMPTDGDRLPHVFQHTFKDDRFPARKFDSLGDDARHTATENGLQVDRESDGLYRQNTIMPRVVVQGDFDITARFANLEMDVQSDGNAGASLLVLVHNQRGENQLSVRRGMTVRKGSVARKVVVALRLQTERGARSLWPADMIQESTAGRLRLQRRGDVVWASYAEHDSNQFQFVWKQQFGDEDLLLQSVRLVLQHMAEGESSVVWKDLEIRAEQIDDRTSQDGNAVVHALNLSRDRMGKKRQFEFVGENRTATLHADTWLATGTGLSDLLVDKDRGVLLDSPADIRRVPRTLAPRMKLAKDFDATVEFSDMEIAAPDGGSHSRFAIEIRWDGATETTRLTEIAIDRRSSTLRILAQHSDASKRESQHKSQRETHAAIPADSVRSLRIARRGEVFHILRAVDVRGAEELVATFKGPQGPIPAGGLVFKIQNGNSTQPTAVWVRRIAIAAD